MAEIRTSPRGIIRGNVKNIPRTLPPLTISKNINTKAHQLNHELDIRLKNKQTANKHDKKQKFRNLNEIVQPRNGKDSQPVFSRSQALKKQRLKSLPAGHLLKKDSSMSLSISAENVHQNPFTVSYPGKLATSRNSTESIRNLNTSPWQPDSLLIPRALPSKRRSSIRSESLDIPALDHGFARIDTCSSMGDHVDALFLSHGSRRRIHSTRHHRKKGVMAAKFRRLAKFLSILFGLWKEHARRVKNFLDTNVDLMEYNEPVQLMFDVTEYKADKQGSISQETRRILMKRPADRTEEEVKYVQIALRNYQTIAEYPLEMTKTMAKRAWLERYDRKRIIIKQHHPAKCCYFILSGSVIVSRMDSEYCVSRTVCFLNRGEQFGELGLISNAPRQASVISREPVELLVFCDEDYVDIFMAGGLREGPDPFFTNMWCFEGWPTEHLTDNPNNCFLSYFKRNTVLVPDSAESEWIYIVKSGSCTVLKKLHEVPPSDKKSNKKHTCPDPAEEHEALMARTESVIKARNSLRSMERRQRELNDLKLGIDVIPLPKKAGLMDSIRFLGAFNAAKESNEAKQKEERRAEEAKENHPSDNNESSDSNTSKQNPFKARSLDSLSSKGPFLKTTPLSSVSDANSTNAASEMPENDSEIPREMSSLAVIQEAVATSSDQDLSTAESLAVLNAKAVEFKEEKKTIMDEINKKHPLRDKPPSIEETKPMFVRVQILTKGAIFGLAEIAHRDQPVLSLISNGCECMLIRKKFYLEYASQDLRNKVRYETSPYPSNVELQGSLQVYVDWVSRKEKTMRDALRNNRRKNMDVHDARSSLTPRMEVPPYNVQLAGPLNG